jgi:hypothetical protein
MYLVISIFFVIMGTPFCGFRLKKIPNNNKGTD